MATVTLTFIDIVRSVNIYFLALKHFSCSLCYVYLRKEKIMLSLMFHSKSFLNVS